MSVYEEMSDTQRFASRVIADHARSTAFAIADGILPGNEGRNYVLRKIMRRAIYHGREHLGLNQAFFYKVCDKVVDEMNGAFPELETQRDFIGKMVRLEEERFGNTLTVGLKKLRDVLTDLEDLINEAMVKAWGIDPEDITQQQLDNYDRYLAERRAELGNDVFVNELRDRNYFEKIAIVYDTYGVPKDLIQVILREKGDWLGEDDFNLHFDEALKKIQSEGSVGKTERKSAVSPIYAEVVGRVGWNQFHGYDGTTYEAAKVVAILDGDAEVSSLASGSQGSVILDHTPFYSESGGQVGDTGVLTNGDLKVSIADTFSPVAGLIIHKAKVDSGTISVGDSVTAQINVEKRDATRRNHTATHLLHAALKEVLGTHVKQAGSVVAPNYLRFDFTHYQPLSDAEIAEVEELVNRFILQNHTVTTNMMSLEDAMRSGAMALFGEKYGAEVRVLSVGDGSFSMELCGGTHVKATGDIGSFKIIADEAIASGVRRIRAITGYDSFERFREDEILIDRSLAALKTQRDNLPNAIERLQDEVKRARKELDELKLKIATGAAGNGSGDGDEPRDIAGVKVVGKVVEGLDANGVRQLSDTLLARLKSGVVILGRKEEGKASLIVRVSADVTDKVKAGNVIKEIVPILGGKGGGRPDMAEGGGPDVDKLNDAIDAGYKVIETFLS